MAIKKRTDQLPAILSGDVDNNDLMYLVHENAQAETGYDSKKILVSDVGRKLNNGVEYATELPSFPPGDQNPLDALEYLNSKINDLYPVDSASGSLVNFTTSLAMPLVALKTNIVAQGGGGTPSAPVPITGFSSITLSCADGEMQTVDTFTLNLGQTVYGGYVDWGNEKLVNTFSNLIDLSDLNWSLVSQDRWECLDIRNDVLRPSANNVKANILCTDFETKTNNDLYSDTSLLGIAVASNGIMYIRNGSTTDTPTGYIAYELSTPIEISIPTTMPSTIEGVQNWFADSGDIELEYKMGVQEYIDKKIAETQALIL